MLNKKLSFVSALFLFVLLGKTAVAQQSLLWKIEGNGLTKPSYLYGTMHSKNQKVFEFNKVVLEKLDECESVAGEIELNPESQMKALALFLIPGKETLEDYVTAKQFKQIQKVVEKEMGAWAAPFAKMKPVFLQMMLQEKEGIKGDMPQSLDEYFQTRGKDKGKKVFGLETMEEQAAVLGATPIDQQAKELVKSVKKLDENRAEAKAQLEKMMKAYLQNDLTTLLSMVDDADTPKEMKEALLDKRNVNMADRMAVAMKDKSLFAAVGAAHLPGAKGVVQLLKSKGFTVTPIEFKFDGTALAEVKATAKASELPGLLGAEDSETPAAATSSGDWVAVEEPELGFKAQFPAQPKRETRLVEGDEKDKNTTATVYMLQQMSQGKILMVNHAKSTKEYKTKDERNAAITQKVQEAIKRFNGKIVEEHEISEQGAEGKRILLSVAGIISLELKVLVKGNDVYQIAFGCQKNKDMTLEKERFYSAFKITK